MPQPDFTWICSYSTHGKTTTLIKEDYHRKYGVKFLIKNLDYFYLAVVIIFQKSGVGILPQHTCADGFLISGTLPAALSTYASTTGSRA